MTTSRTADPDAMIAALIVARSDPDQPTAAERQAEDERRRLNRRQRDARERNRIAWQQHHERLAERLSAQAALETRPTL